MEDQTNGSETDNSSGGAVSHATSAVKDAATEAVTVATDVARDAKDATASIAGDLKQKAEDEAGAQKDAAADTLGDAAEALHRSAKELEGHQDWLAKLVDSGAGELGGLAETLRSNDLQGLLGKLQDLAQRQPAVFVGAAMAAGFAAVRLGKMAVAGATDIDLPKMQEVRHEPN